MDAAENEVIKTAFWVVAGLRDAFCHLRPVLDYFAGLRDIFRHLGPVLPFYIGVMSTILLFCGSESYILPSETRF